MRITSSIASTAILPSPIEPVRAVSSMVEITVGASVSSTTTSMRTFGTKSTSYSGPRDVSVLPAGAPESTPTLIESFRDGAARYGQREHSPNIIRRLEEATGLDIRAPGFPAEMLDGEPEEPGHEVVPNRG